MLGREERYEVKCLLPDKKIGTELIRRTPGCLIANEAYLFALEVGEILGGEDIKSTGGFSKRR
jgi:hypothetical protein